MIQENVARPATVSVTEAAGILGVSRATAYNYVKAGELPSVRVGRGRILIPRHRLARFLDGRSESALEKALG